MSNPFLDQLINDFSIDHLDRFMRERSGKYRPSKSELAVHNDDSFAKGVKTGEIDFGDNEKLIVCAFECRSELSEKAGKKAQYEKAKKILKDLFADAGIFVFYDKKGDFRFSLVYSNFLGQKRDWSTYRRFTYYVDKGLTNKTFRKRIGEGDFSSMKMVKEDFSVEKVTKEFYEGISYWYFWAVKNCVFPKDAEAEENGRNISVIRLITRMIFVWFMRERQLVPGLLFNESKIKELLNDFSDDSSSYYHAILQNLFFATLSTRQSERTFRERNRGPKGVNKDFGNPYVYRFEDQFNNPDTIHSIFVDIPFLNGGLFDCLDDAEKGIYVDGFSEIKKNQATIPNFLFFNPETKVDLSTEFESTNKSYPVKGLINLLSEFNFTIDENTTDDKDVALDPELLGQVFENLLASFNPETSSTARKATGSYYTPREIVDYMVDESLKGYFKSHLETIENLDAKLTELFNSGSVNNPFNGEESKRIVKLIESVRVVDPAVGSGAFPMGMLNRFVSLLQKVDPINQGWKQEQLDAAAKMTDMHLREETKHRIEEYFKKNPNYGRKLFLIQKCIYGVDIQQIAVEIAKLRFFISLLVDEDIDTNKPNWGIEPLPNLDFKIMQGNSLIADFLGVNFEIKKQSSTSQVGFDFQDERSILINQFENKKIEYQNESDKERKKQLINEIDNKTIEIFTLMVKQQKESYFNAIESIKRKNSVIPGREEREAINQKEVERINLIFGFDIKNSEKQLREYTGRMKTRPFFPWQLFFAEVFTEKNGFDIVIGNPPYIGEKGHKELFRSIANSENGKKYYQRKMDIFYFFFHVSLDLTHHNSIIALITTNYFITADGARFLRQDVEKRSDIRLLVDFGEMKLFESASGQHNMITILTRSKQNSIAKVIHNYQTGRLDQNSFNRIINFTDGAASCVKIKQSELYTGPDRQIFINNNELNLSETKSPNQIITKLLSNSKPLSSFSYEIFMGIQTGCDVVTENLIKSALKKKLITPKEATNYQVGEGIYVLSETELEKLRLPRNEFACIKPFYKNSEIKRYFTPKNSKKFLLYVDSKTDLNLFPTIKKHLEKFKPLLAAREQAVTGSNNWFWIRGSKRDSYFYRKESIVVPYRAKTNRFSLCHQDIYGAGDVYYIVLYNQWSSVASLLGYLNSTSVLFYLLHRGKKKGEIIEFYKKPLENIPVPICLFDQPIRSKMEEFVFNILEMKTTNHEANTEELEKSIDKLVYEIFGFTNEEIAVIEGKK